MRELERGKIDPEFTPTSHDPVPKPGGAGQGIGRGRGGRLSALTAVGAPGNGDRGRNPTSQETKEQNPENWAKIFTSLWSVGFKDQFFTSIFETSPDAARDMVSSTLGVILKNSYLSEQAREFTTKSALWALETEIIPMDIIPLWEFGLENKQEQLVGFRLQTLMAENNEHIFKEGPHLIATEIFLLSDYMQFKENRLYGFTSPQEDNFQELWGDTLVGIIDKYKTELR